MSDALRISYIVEGKTDFTVINALVKSLLEGRDYVPNQIQPPTSDYAGGHGPLGGGWQGVLRWCQNQGEESAQLGGFANSLVLRNCDCLIIHVDADIAEEADLARLALGSAAEPQQTCDNIRNLVAALLGGDPPPGQLVMCVPAQCTEAWVFVALHTAEAANHSPIEQRRQVERLLIGQPERLVRDKDGAAKKVSDRYRAMAERIALSWPSVVAICAQAQLFQSELTALLS